MTDNAPQAGTPAQREAAIRARLAAIPDSDYAMLPEVSIPYWMSIGLRDPSDPERFNVVAEVSTIAIQRPGGVEDRKHLPEFIASAPADVRTLLDALDQARQQRDAALRIADALDAALEAEGVDDVIAQMLLANLHSLIDIAESRVREIGSAADYWTRVTMGRG